MKISYRLVHLADTANELVLSQNNIKTVPIFLSQFNRIARLDLSKNLINDLPPEFGLLQTLRELNISYNKCVINFLKLFLFLIYLSIFRFKDIPNCIYALKNLEILLAKDNQIETINATCSGLGALTRLAVLDFSNNNIAQVPPILGNLRNIM